MSNIHAPWRIEFIRGEKPQGCFFCNYLAAPPENDRANLLLQRSDQAFVLLNRYPYTGGHLMVALNRHGGQITDATDAELAESSALGRRCVAVLEQVVKAEGFNLGWNLGRCAGAGVVDHLHLHVVPRWRGDTNFMPVLADVTVIPEALSELYDQLRPHFEA